MKRILITGATGFVGRHVTSLLADKLPGWEIYCVQRPDNSPLEISGRKVLSKLQVTKLLVDLDLPQSVERLPHKFEYIIHLAASAETSEKNHSFNARAMDFLLSHINPKTIKHFIFTSTTAVWSGRKNLAIGIHEGLAPLPSNEYGRSKIVAEQLLNSWSQKHRVPVTVLRLSTVYGPSTRANGLFDALKQLIPKGSYIPKLNWPGKTSLVYVRDLAELLLLAIKTKPAKRQNLYIVSEESLTMAEISEFMHQAMKITYTPIIIPQFLWNMGGFFSQYFYLLEFLPGKIYNFFWRSTLIVNSTLFCDSDRLKKAFPKWKRSKFADHVKEVISS